MPPKLKTVLVGTGILFDPALHAGQATEIITLNTFNGRQLKTVLIGTGILFNHALHAGQTAEVITAGTFNNRQLKTVLAGTGILFNPALHAGQATEVITSSAFNGRQLKTVLIGTGILFDPAFHAGQATEVITSSAFNGRQLKTVLIGIGILFDPALHAGQATETITASVFYQRQSKKVLTEAGILVNRALHAGQTTETITANDVNHVRHKSKKHFNQERQKVYETLQNSDSDNDSIINQNMHRHVYEHTSLAELVSNEDIDVFFDSSPVVIECPSSPRKRLPSDTTNGHDKRRRIEESSVPCSDDDDDDLMPYLKILVSNTDEIVDFMDIDEASFQSVNSTHPSTMSTSAQASFGVPYQESCNHLDPISRTDNVKTFAKT